MSELAHGLLLQEQGRLEEAESCFYHVLAREPENDYVYGRLALCQLSQPGKKKKALESIGEAIRIRSDDAFYHAVRSLVLSELRRGKESLEAATAAVALNPEDGFVLAAKANAYCSLDRWADAEEWSRRALAADGDNAMASNLLAHALRMQGKSGENAAAVERLLAADPEDSLAHVNAGWGALQRNDHRKAEEHFLEALRLDPDSEMAREGLLESFRARSWFYRCYLSYCFFLQRFTGGKQWAIIIGLYVVYQVARNVLGKFSPVVAAVLGILWLALVMWVWLAPGIGNALILLDRSARLALERDERIQGAAVGGGLVLGVAGIVAGLGIPFLPALLAGAGLLASTVPASLAFGNESRAGRILFGSILAYLYAVTAGAFAFEWIHPTEGGVHHLTVTLGTIGLVGAIACTWLGNVRSLRLSPGE